MSKAADDGYHLIQIAYASGHKEFVIEKDSHILSHSEAQQHAPECIRAMRDELQRGRDCGGFSRYPRQSSKNLLDSRWVLKWAWSNDKWIVKARMTVRGYKDLQANVVRTSSSTASRWGQRIVVLVACQYEWELFGADVAQAFLKGLRFDELAKLPGEVRREVQFEVPPGSVPILRMIEGFEDYDPMTEVLAMLC